VMPPEPGWPLEWAPPEPGNALLPPGFRALLQENFEPEICALFQETFEVWVHNPTRKAEIDDFDAFWAWVEFDVWMRPEPKWRPEWGPPPPPKPFSRTVKSQILEMMPPAHGTAARQDIIDQLLAAADLKRIPADFDPDALYGDLRTCIWHYYAAVERQSKSEKDQIAELTKTIEMARQLVLRVNSEDAQEYTKNSTREAVITVLEGLIRDRELKKMSLTCRFWIDRLEEKVMDPYYEMTAGLPPGALGTYTGWNPLTWLVGYFLPPVFEKHFGCEPHTTLDGQYARFADAFLRAFGIMIKGKPYELGTIVRAMGDVRYKRHRKKTRA
jgi:hypothetical protein